MYRQFFLAFEEGERCEQMVPSTKCEMLVRDQKCIPVRPTELWRWLYFSGYIVRVWKKFQKKHSLEPSSNCLGSVSRSTKIKEDKLV